ncbi:molybdopterin-synthase adenylyltransferase MoeB [Pontibacter akesuensis]|uniref:Molybdopterin-synthase adenylyltransferase n=1 Tax=Pontibacter akesuensis TaxID=388950 RepID=A0A1I7JBJ5_9BACT|nr:molybdopterin-synthase adenylyltransferase MoeB [Pontibacter akesuensis]GHA71213.1 molybdenum cofactor biosynthesis protein MoeB [Pontibacter akesuensis]SFU82503.1 adenylyltransferase and sulfurtransferase [Pontibacter akesuensis]
MLEKEEVRRYNRQLILPELGQQGQEKLKQAKVLMIGAGGLGCPVLQYLTAAGVGTIGIADMDVVNESNLHRQILYTLADVGKLKAEVAALKLSQQNPFVQFNIHHEGITIENALELVQQYDVVVDGSDNFPTRYLVNDACAILRKPLVFGSIFKFEGQVTVFNYKNGPTYRCLFPEPPGQGEVPNCAETGVIGVLPGIIGTLQANEAIKVISELGEVASGKLLLFDALTLSFSSFKFTRTANAEVKQLQPDYDLAACAAPETSIQEISAQEYKAWLQSGRKVQLLDVREPQEYDLCNIGGELLPLSTLTGKPAGLHLSQEVVVHCQAGSRSKKAIAILQSYFPEVRFYNMKGGLAAWEK